LWFDLPSTLGREEIVEDLKREIEDRGVSPPTWQSAGTYSDIIETLLHLSKFLSYRAHLQLASGVNRDSTCLAGFPLLAQTPD